MDTQELAKKQPMATPGFTIITPKEESEYDKMIREKQEARLDGCCDGYSPYDQYGYKPRHNSPPQDLPNPDSAPQTDKKTNKR
jgi:hypothetical protein